MNQRRKSIEEGTIPQDRMTMNVIKYQRYYRNDVFIIDLDRIKRISKSTELKSSPILN